MIDKPQKINYHMTSNEKKSCKTKTIKPKPQQIKTEVKKPIYEPYEL
jgi:hypothetical protein